MVHECDKRGWEMVTVKVGDAHPGCGGHYRESGVRLQNRFTPQQIAAWCITGDEGGRVPAHFDILATRIIGCVEDDRADEPAIDASLAKALEEERIVNAQLRKAVEEAGSLRTRAEVAEKNAEDWRLKSDGHYEHLLRVIGDADEARKDAEACRRLLFDEKRMHENAAKEAAGLRQRLNACKEALS